MIEYRFPSINIPKILIGPGTGCAPFCFYINTIFDKNDKNQIFLGFRY